MTVAQILIGSLLLTVLFGVGFSYYSNAQKMLSIRRELDKLQAQARSAHACSLLRNERARCHLELQSLEAELSTSGRTALSVDEIKRVELSRTTIKNCDEALKGAGDWLGLPFDLEWVDMLERLPHLDKLYRQSLDNPVLVTSLDPPDANVPENVIGSTDARTGVNTLEATLLDTSPGGFPNPDPNRTF
jgi:hypothetical protein